MKLHLPKALFAAVVAACMANMSAQALTGWGNNNGWQGDVYFIESADATTVDTTGHNNRVGIVNDSKNRIDATAAVTLKNGDTLAVCVNPWDSNKLFNTLALTDITVKDNGSMSLEILDNQTVNISNITGTVSQVNNTGTLTIGTENSTTTFGGTITNTGTMTVNGSISITNIAGFSLAQNGSNTTIWSDTTNQQGFKSLTGSTRVLATGGVTFTAGEVTVDGTTKALTTTDGVTTFDAGTVLTETGTTYYLINSDATAGAAGTEGATAYDVASGRTLYIVDSSADNATLNLKEGSTVNISNASRTFTNSSLAQHVVIGNNGVVTISGASGGNAFIRGNVDVNAGGKLVLNGNDSLGWNNNNNINILGSEDALATVELKGKQTLKANINLLGNARMTNAGDGALEFYGNNTVITASGTNNTIAGNLMARDAGTISVAENGELRITGNLTCNTGQYGDPGTITKEGLGDLVFDGSSNTLYGAMNVNAGSVEFTNGLNLQKATTSGSLNMGSNTTLILGAGIINTGEGTVTIGGNLVINNSGTGYEFYQAAAEGTYSDGENGFYTSTGSQYYLVKGGAVDLSGMGTALLDGTTEASIEVLDNNGGAIFTAGSTTTAEYLVNTTVNSSSHETATYKFNADGAKLVVNSTLSNSRIEGTGAVEVATNGTLILDTNNGSVNSLLTSATGAGTIVLSTSTTLTDTAATVATGKLSISEGATLTVGGGDAQTVSIASFKTGVELDGGKIYYQNKGGVINNLSVTSKNGTFEMYDMGQVADNALLTLAGTTTLNGNLTYKNTWNSQINIEKVTGNGNLTFDGSSRNLSNTSTINVLDAENFTGRIEYTGNADNLKLVVAEGLGITTRYHRTTGRSDNGSTGTDLTGIGAGNTIILQGAAGKFTAGTIAADVVIKNTDDGALAGADISGVSGGETFTYTGTISGSGNYIIRPATTTTTQFTGDTSGWKGNMEVTSGEHNVVYSGSTVINNSVIRTRTSNGGTTPTMNLTIAHDSAAVTVNSSIEQQTGTINLTANAAQGVTFKKAVTASTTTLGDGTAASFEANANLGNLTLGAGATVTATGSLTIGSLTLDLASYTTEYTTHTLVSAGGELSFTGDLSSYQGVTVGDYTASITQMGNSLVLNFVTLSTEPTSLSVTGVAGCVDGLLTLTVNADLLNYDFTNNGAIIIPGIDGGIMSDILNLTTLPADGMVGIALQGTDGETLSATAEGQIGFLGKDGVSVYYGESTEAGWAYQANYIPEPATATLSLLALAGLAARRRRK